MTQEAIKRYINEAFRIATEHGFHNEEKCKEHWLMLVMTEVSEAVDADRKGDFNGVESFLERTHVHPDFNERYDAYIKGSVAEELADAFIRLCDYAGTYDLTPAESPGGDMYAEWLKIFEDKSFTYAAYSLCNMITFPNIPDEQMLGMTLTFIECWAKFLNIDLVWHIETKMKYNENRAMLHGKSY